MGRLDWIRLLLKFHYHYILLQLLDYTGTLLEGDHLLDHTFYQLLAEVQVLNQVVEDILFLMLL
jgi:hypothetical protein